MRGGIPVTERFDERGDVTAVVGRQLVDAGDQELSLLIARLPLPARGLVVVVQSCGLGGGGAYHGDGHVEPFGERVDGGRAWRPDQVPCGGEGVDRGPGKAAAAGDLSVRPAAVAKPFLDQALQRVDRTLWRRPAGLRSLPGKIRPAIRSVRRHTYQPNPCLVPRRSAAILALTDPKSYCTVMTVQSVRRKTHRVRDASSKEASMSATYHDARARVSRRRTAPQPGNPVVLPLWVH